MGGGGNSGSSQGSGSSSGTNTLYGGGSFTPLVKTKQVMSPEVYDGVPVMVFDHPFTGKADRIYGQGSAYPNGPQNTCGCCAAGTIINKAGGKTTERQMVDHALANGLCDSKGFTSADTISQMLGDAGIKSTVAKRLSMDDLARMVEEGRGVIIGVDTYAFYPGFGIRCGHAIVIESVVRDAKTGKIIDFVVADSNAPDHISVCNRISVKKLKRAYKRKGRQAIITDDVIW